MYYFAFVFVLAALLSFSPAYAFSRVLSDSCSTIDVRDNMQGRLKEHFHTPVHQGEIGWCYAYAASDVLSQKVGQPVSPIFTASYYQTQIGALGRLGRSILNGEEHSTESGFIGSALHLLKDLGQACTTRGLTPHGLFAYELVPSYFNLGDMEKWSVLVQEARAGTCDDWCLRKMKFFSEHFVPHMSQAEVLQIIRRNHKNTVEQTMFSLVNAHCGINKVRVSPWMKIVSGSEEPQIESNIRRDFDFAKTLVYKLNRALEKGKVVGLEYNVKDITQDATFLTGFHASTVIGRKLINGTCYYNVRNSQGSNCDYKPGIICSKEDGSFWIEQDALRRATSKIVYVD